MALTEFGKAVRKARIDTGQTLLGMAAVLETTASFLSAMETGRKKVGAGWVEKIDRFFRERGVAVPRLKELAAVANESVSLEGLPLQQQMLVAGFARSRFTAEELKQIAELLGKINNKKSDNDQDAGKL
ncbi:XRE family transcriptional regulator [Parapusillimonas sp. JC17]|uniref:XRE family transcriptional regulator n=1 Tax=Parapusillimonas sp. JC17 TaxID=3445768 RepID=UPI003FA10F96